MAGGTPAAPLRGASHVSCDKAPRGLVRFRLELAAWQAGRLPLRYRERHTSHVTKRRRKLFVSVLNWQHGRRDACRSVTGSVTRLV